MGKQIGFLWRLLLVVTILLGGFALRVIDTGAAPLQGDEVWTAYLAFDFGHNGHRNELGVVSSTGLNQSPFFADLFALPFALSPDAEIARLWMAELHLVGMAVLYMVGRRFWSARTALASLAIFATMPSAVWAGRYLWNPYLAFPFMIAYYATGLLLASGHRWARWLHPLMLACAIQAHPSAIGNLPLSLGFYAADFARVFVTKRIELDVRVVRRYVSDHLIGVLLAAVSLLPWLIGVLRLRASKLSPGPLLDWTPASPLSRILQFAFDAPMRLDVGSFGLPVEADIPLSNTKKLLYHRFGETILVLSVILVVWGLAQMSLRRRHGFATFMIGAAYLVFPAMLSMLPSDTYGFYLLIVVPAAALVLGVALVGPGRPRAVTAIGVAVVVLVVGMQLERSLDGLHAVRAFNDFSRDSALGWREMVRLRNEGVRPGIETIYLVEGGSTNDFEQALLWQMLAVKGKSRVIWGRTTTLPVPAAGATYVGYEGATHIPELYSEPKPRMVVEGVYRVVDLPPDSMFAPQCTIPGPNRLDNGAVFQGYVVPNQTLPEPGLPWTLYVLWTVEKTPKNSARAVNYQLFVHLVDANGVRYAQQDIDTVWSGLWRPNEQMVSRMTLPIPNDMPAGEPLELRVGMYTLPDVTGANVIDSSGNPVGTWVTIPICITKQE
jgi:hypothetical protein